MYLLPCQPALPLLDEARRHRVRGEIALYTQTHRVWEHVSVSERRCMQEHIESERAVVTRQWVSSDRVVIVLG